METAMSIGTFCNRDVVIVDAQCTIVEAARLMREHHVGSLVIVTNEKGVSRPQAIITDRDLVIEVLAAELDARALRVGEVATEALCSVRDDDGVFDAVHRMRERGVRRAPVVDANGALQGIVSVDDLIVLLGEEMNELARLIAREQAQESRNRP
jgi:CBS domain-containing protein